MANPLFNSLFGGVQHNGDALPQNDAGKPEMPNGSPQMNMQEAMRELRANPAEMIRKGGYKVPDSIASDPKATVMHLIQSGQVGGPMMKMIMPMLSRMGGR